MTQTYQIVEIAPVYNSSTDAHIGSRVASRSHGYLTAALALKICGIQADRAYAHFSDNYFVVVPFDACPFDRSNRVKSLAKWTETGDVWGADLPF